MIPADASSRQINTPDSWQREMAGAFDEPVALLAALGLTPEQLRPPQTSASLRAAAKLFPMRVPQAWVARIRSGEPLDPLLLQVLPSGAETLQVPGFSQDPLAEGQARRSPGLLHKYQGRALLIATGACAVHCRYCIRRHYY